MKASTHNGLIYLQANLSQGDIDKTKKVAQWMQDNRGYDLIDGDDNPDTYHIVLGRHGSAKDAMVDYKDAKKAA